MNTEVNIEKTTVSFVILHYGEVETTDTCVQSILKMEQQLRIQIVIVDNEITKTRCERKRIIDAYKDFSNINVIQIEKNGGFSYANNCGYQFAREILHSDFIILLNNDIEFSQTDFINRLDLVYEQDSCHIIAPDVLRKKNQEHQNPMDTKLRTLEQAQYTIRMNRRALKYFDLLYPALYLYGKHTEKKRIIENKNQSLFYQTKQEAIVPFGACLIFTPLFIRKEKKAFDPETKFYYEEYILALRCKRLNYRILYHPDLLVYHESGKATQSKAGTDKKKMRFMMEHIADAAAVYLDFCRSGVQDI